MQRLDLVLQRMAETGLKLKPEKCQLLKPEVAFLGHLVSDKGIQPNPDNIAKILAMPPPTSHWSEATVKDGKLLQTIYQGIFSLG